MFGILLRLWAKVRLSGPMSRSGSPSTGISDARSLEGGPVVGEVADELRFGFVAEG